MFLAQPRHAVSVSPVKATDEIPAPFVWLSLVLVAGPSLYALAYFQHRLLESLWPGAPGALTYGLALAVDSFGAMCGVYWFRSRRNASLRRWGRTFAIVAVLGSTALMVWAIARIYPGAQVLGGLPAVIVFGSTKLVTMWQADRAQVRDGLGEAAAQVETAERDRDAALRELDAERTARAELAARLDALEAAARARPGPVRDATTDTGPIPMQERTASAPGSGVTNIAAGASMTDRAREYALAFVAEHGREPTGGEVDTAIGSKSLGRKVLRKMRDAGELEIPPASASA